MPIRDYTCARCNKTFARYSCHVRGMPYCSKACCDIDKIGRPSKRRPMIGPDHSQWNGGRYVCPRGYIHIWKPDHPNVNANGYVAEHRMVMADAIGRPLMTDEHVHHRDQNTQNNELSNLELLTASEHTKQHRAGRKKGWERLGHGCKECGSTTAPYKGSGYCNLCHARLWMRLYYAKKRLGLR